jgi:hypothetical protein
MTLRIESYTGAMTAFAARVARRMVASGAVGDYKVIFDEVIGECGIAWCHARDHWREDSGVPFIAYFRLGMRHHINRWAAKELAQHNASHLEFDAPSLEDDDGCLLDVFADRSVESAEDTLLASDLRSKQLAKLSPRAAVR